MRRELIEEINYSVPFIMKLAGVEVIEGQDNRRYFLFAIYHVQLQAVYTPSIGVDTTEVYYVDPQQYKNSADRSLQLIYKYGADDATATIDYRIQ